jgi:hypothetical protein
MYPKFEFVDCNLSHLLLFAHILTKRNAICNLGYVGNPHPHPLSSIHIYKHTIPKSQLSQYIQYEYNLSNHPLHLSRIKLSFLSPGSNVSWRSPVEVSTTTTATK